MSIEIITTEDLRKMSDTDGLILQGCGGELQDWIDGINNMFTENGILLNGSKFEKVYAFKNGNLTNLLYPLDDVELSNGKLALWRITTHSQFYGTGKIVTSEVTFTPKKSSGKVTVSFTFDSSAIKKDTELLILEVVEIFDWLGDIVSGLGDAIGNAFGSISDKLIDGILNRIIQWIFTVIYDGIAEFFTMISGLGVEIFELDWVNAVVKLFSLFGWTLFVVGLVVSAFDLAIEYQNGRASIHGTAINWIKGFMAVSLFTITPIELYKFCVTLQNTLSKDLTRIFASQQGTTLGEVALKTLQFAFFKDGAIVQAGLFELVAIIALGYCVVKIFFDNIKRGGILLVQIAVGSLYMFSIPRGYGEGFTQWMKQVIALCLTAFLQTTLLFLGLLTWTDNMLLAIGIMMAASEVPRIAERFGLDTSVKFNMMSAVHMTSTAVNLAKNIAK